MDTVAREGSAISMDEILQLFGDEIRDAEQETAVTFALAGSNRDLGMFDPKATNVAFSVTGDDYSFKQSPGLLRSSRDRGTTGAVLWHTSRVLAEWLSPNQNPLFAHGILNATSQVVELGCGVNPVLALTLVDRIARFVATDQDYVLKLYRQNLEDNGVRAVGRRGKGQTRRNATASKHTTTTASTPTSFEICELDWELDDVGRKAPWHGREMDENGADVDMVIACDCIYNENMLQPFVSTCKTICQLRRSGAATLCVVAQQLRAPDVYEQWLGEMLRQEFRVWRVRDDGRSALVSEKSGFTVHVAMLQES